MSGNLALHLTRVHGVIADQFPDVDRVALAVYDPSTDMLKTFLSSSTDTQPLKHYETRLRDIPALEALAHQRKSRVIDDIQAAPAQYAVHAQWLREMNYRSSLTVPIHDGDRLAAFLFFDSYKARAFTLEVAQFLEVFADLISQHYLLQQKVAGSLIGIVRLVSELAGTRDQETGQHLDRMGQYAHLMATKLADSHHFSDLFVEQVRLFAPMHDIGKVGIPDSILLKPGKLNAEEWNIMRTHVELGIRIVDKIRLDTGFGDDGAITVIRNIVACHHERGDGNGYPRGLQMHEIPMEGRLIAVADVYDALTSARPYKAPWTEEAAIVELRKEVERGRLDGDCVEALVLARAERLAIQLQFCDTPQEARECKSVLLV
ncbi:HD-GYP domain-containing protein [Rhodoferax saidenbachensis]|nr:HD domain-containing phosphohydrolase [Rhodoferax saidenbachensis]